MRIEIEVAASVALDAADGGSGAEKWHSFKEKVEVVTKRFQLQEKSRPSPRMAHLSGGTCKALTFSINEGQTKPPLGLKLSLFPGHSDPSAQVGGNARYGSIVLKKSSLQSLC